MGKVSRLLTIAVKDLCASLEPHGLLELDTKLVLQELREHAAQGAQHGPPSVDELDLTVPAGHRKL